MCGYWLSDILVVYEIIFNFSDIVLLCDIIVFLKYCVGMS